jgi:two-component system, OmpR family, phosphate regulon response regulator PhoB
MSLGKVLIVEDEEIIRETVALALTDEGYDLLTAADGRSGLELLQANENTIDLVILDVMLPHLNGLDICRILRRRGNQVPILMLSARGAETDRVVGLEVGADDYLTKPFGMRELIARCRALMRRQQQFQTAPEQTVLDFQEIIYLYPQQCRVLVREKEVNLSPKEYKLLELFMTHPKRVWSREQLLENVWGYDFIGDSKTVDVHIRWLREKIELDPSAPQHLMTVRGFGYRLG